MPGPYKGAQGRTWYFREDAKADLAANPAQPAPARSQAPSSPGRVQQAGNRAYNTVVVGKGTSGAAKTYHRIVLAEFAVCIVLVGMSPVLTPRKASGSNVAASATGQAADLASMSLAPFLVRLTAVCVLFFVLALMATGPKAGKVAAAFGGLVVLGALLNATEELSILAKALTGGQGKTATAAGGAP